MPLEERGAQPSTSTGPSKGNQVPTPEGMEERLERFVEALKGKGDLDPDVTPDTLSASTKHQILESLELAVEASELVKIADALDRDRDNKNLLRQYNEGLEKMANKSHHQIKLLLGAGITAMLAIQRASNGFQDPDEDTGGSPFS